MVEKSANQPSHFIESYMNVVVYGTYKFSHSKPLKSLSPQKLIISLESQFLAIFRPIVLDLNLWEGTLKTTTEQRLSGDYGNILFHNHSYDPSRVSPVVW